LGTHGTSFTEAYHGKINFTRGEEVEQNGLGMDLDLKRVRKNNASESEINQHYSMGGKGYKISTYLQIHFGANLGYISKPLLYQGLVNYEKNLALCPQC